MFSSLSESFTKVLTNIKRKGSISENDLESSLREIRISMLEADVALSVTKEFIQNVKVKALGEEVINSVTPGQMIVKIVHDELKNILGDNEQALNLNATPSCSYYACWTSRCR